MRNAECGTRNRLHAFRIPHSFVGLYGGVKLPFMTPITGAFNDAYIAEMYERFRQNPESVDESWRQFFGFAQSLSGAAPAAADPSLLR